MTDSHYRITVHNLPEHKRKEFEEVLRYMLGSVEQAFPESRIFLQTSSARDFRPPRRDTLQSYIS